jgi:hypothetical protein
MHVCMHVGGYWEGLPEAAVGLRMLRQGGRAASHGATIAPEFAAIVERCAQVRIAEAFAQFTGGQAAAPAAPAAGSGSARRESQRPRQPHALHALTGAPPRPSTPRALPPLTTTALEERGGARQRSSASPPPN